MNELKTLETDKGLYDSFPDQTAREQITKIPVIFKSPINAQKGYYLRAKTVVDGVVTELEAVPAPEGGNGGSSVVIDPTLTIAGQAADAKATGDAISKLSKENVAQMEPVEDDIPCVYFSTGGKGMPFTKDEGERQVRMVYESRTQIAEYYLTAKVQGGSSAANPSYKKRNWTFKFYTDGTYEKKLKLAFRSWPAMNKFVLKAGWVIPGHLRNVGAAQVWGQIMRSRTDYDTLPEELRESANQGATDGFHVRVFIDGTYWGIYDWIVAKDQLFNQDKDNPNHSILNSERNDEPTCAFATTTPTIEGNWSEELLDSMTPETKTSMENWVKFVAGATDEEFLADAESYFDVQSVIDAICFDRIILPVDNMCRNQIVFKYDTKWFMGKWDLDAILGLPPVAGQPWYSYDTPYQEGYVAYKDFGIINLLYKRTEELFMERFKTRYWELRKAPLSENNIVRTFGKLSDRLRSIEGLLAEENASTTGNGQFTGMPNVEHDTIQQIREFVVQRCAYMDEVVTNMVPAVPATGITLNASTLNFVVAEPQTLTATVEPSDTTDVVVWKSSDISIATVENGVVTPIANGNVTITATAGRVSAGCAVSVAFPVLSCTGITLNASTLSFNAYGSQTLTATVTPEGCTDPVTWESDDNNVATVGNGVVTVVGNGTCNITARCGDYSAVCAVVVEFDYSQPLIGAEFFTKTTYDGTTGNFKAKADEYCTSKFHMAQHLYEFSAPGSNWAIFAWDKNGDYIGRIENSKMTMRFVPNPDWVYAVKVYSPNAEVTLNDIALAKIDNASTAIDAVELTLADIVYTTRTVFGTAVAQADLSEIPAFSGVSDLATAIETANQFVLVNCNDRSLAATWNNMPAASVFALVMNSGVPTLWCNVSGDNANTLFAENGTVLAIN